MTAEVRPRPGAAVLPWNTMADAPYAPSERQREFHAASERYRLYGGAVGGGKTTALAVESLLTSWDYPYNEGVIGRRDFDDLRRTTYAEVLKWCPPELIKQHHKSEHWLELINGSVIHFMELKDAGGLKNMNLGWFAIDQAEEVPYESYMWLQSRLRRVGIPHYYGLLSANPEPGWVKDLFVSEQTAGHLFIPALPEDNPYLPDDYVSSLLERWPETYVRKLLLGSWDVVENAIYPQLDRTRHIRDLPEGLQMVDGAIGVDVGDVHPSAVVCVQRDSMGMTWVREVWSEEGGDYDAIWGAINRMRQTYNVSAHKVRVDPMLKGWEKLTPVSRADSSPGSRRNRIELVTRLLNGRQPSFGELSRETQPSLVFVRDGKHNMDLFNQMTMYRWDIQETQSVQQYVVHRYEEDMVAALEYAIEALETAPGPLPTSARMGSRPQRNKMPGWRSV